MKKDDIDERRRQVRRFMALRIPLHITAELLGCHKATIQADMKLVKEQLIAEAVCTSEAALVAHEEIESILQLASDLSIEMQSTTSVEDRGRLAQTAAHCLFLAGRLKQGRDP